MKCSGYWWSGKLSTDSEGGSSVLAQSTEVRRPHLKTPLSRKLAKRRQAILDAGLPLLGWDEIEAEIADRRGERYPDVHATWADRPH